MIQSLPYGSCSNHLIWAAEFGALRVTETAYAPRERLPTHAHSQPALVFVLEGNFTETYGPMASPRARGCSCGDALLRPAGEEHADCFSIDRGRCLNVEIPPAWQERTFPEAPWPDRSIEIGRAAAGIATRLFRECRVPDEASPMIVEGVVLELLGSVLRRCGERVLQDTPQWLKRACEMLTGDLAEPQSLTRVAAELRRTPLQIARAFRAHLGCTAGEYRRRVRVERACRLLITTDLPLTSVAAELGFYDQSHFCRVFARAMRTTPAAYRAIHRRSPLRTMR
jgi:AraC family transcriptional regulator